jgi:hypothetical protein
MDNGEKEREVVNSFKEIVKHTSKRKSTTQLSKQRDPIIRIAPKALDDSMENSSCGLESNVTHGDTPPIDRQLSQEDGVEGLQNRSAVST